MTTKIITLTTTVSRTPDLLFADVGNEVVMMNIDKGMYYALDDIASEIWALLEVPNRVIDLCTTLLAEFDISLEEGQQDVLAFLVDLQERNLLEVHE